MSVQKVLPSAQTADGLANVPSRADQYLAAYITATTNKEFAYADEGSYFVGITPTPGTGIIGHAAPTTFDQTKPYLLLYNSSTTKSLYPQFVTFNETVAGVGGTGLVFTAVIDNTNRYASAGTALTVANTNGASSNATVATSAFCGAVVASAATAGARNYGDYVFRGTTIDIIGDKYTLVFGTPASNGGASSKVATLIDSTIIAPPLVVGPGQSFLLHQWRASQSTGPTFQVVMGWTER